MARLDADGPAALAPFNVSRETSAKLETLVSELRRWQAIKNLVSRGTLEDLWSRHIADSIQLLDLAPHAGAWLDLGSGAGFPGLVLAIAGQGRGLLVHLVESDRRKCAFLSHVARLTEARAMIYPARLEAVVPEFVGRVDVVSARALAPLRQLLSWTEPLLKSGTVGLFPKGRTAADELTKARESWRFAAEVLPSRTDPEAGIVRITSLTSGAP